MHFLDDGHLGGHFFAASLQAIFVDGRLPLQGFQRGVGIHEPRQPQFAGSPHHRIEIRCHPYRRMGLLNRANGAGRVVQIEVSAMERDFVLRPQTLNQLQRFQESPNPVASLHVERLVLDITVAEADAQNDAAIADYVQRRHSLRHVGRRIQRQQQDGQHQFHVARIRGQSGQQRNALQVLIGRRQEVLPAGY